MSSSSLVTATVANSNPPARPGPVVDLGFPSWSQFLFRPARYKVAYGGRGSTKSWSFARALVFKAAHQKLRILCARELQTSIQESVHKLLSDQIALMQLSHYYDIQQNGIYGKNGSEFIFYGLRNNTTKIKSTEGIDICWVEEAEKVSDVSWKILIPTIREADSEIWVTFNPDENTDPTYKRFVLEPPPDAVVMEVNWHQNPWFPDVLRKEKDYLYRVDPDAAAWVWGGQCRTNKTSQVLRGKYVVEAFTAPNETPGSDPLTYWDGPYYGADWGFSQDPTVFAKYWIAGAVPQVTKGKLMVEHEAYAIGCEIMDTPALARQIPGIEDGLIRADNSRPETISHVRNEGELRVEAAEKWTGSVEDGVAFLRSFEQIVIHPRCKHHEEEARLYSHKIDRLTGDVLQDIVDKHNHCWDAARYALDAMIRAGTSLGVWGRL